MSYYSRTALRELKKRYLNILKKCFLANLMAFSFILPLRAETTEPTLTPSEELATVTKTTRTTISSDTTIDLAGKNLTYSGITSSSNGGVFYVNSAKTLEFTNSSETTDPLLLFENNSASSSGGAINNYGTITFGGDATFSGNSASSSGGAIYSYGTITFGGDATFSGNSASSYYGGAIYNNGATSTFNGDATFTGNSASSSGGAIYNLNSGTITFNGDATFTGNSASSFYGGAIYNEASGSTAKVNITFNGDVTFTGNSVTSSSSSGGAIYNKSGTITFGENSSVYFSNNKANDKLNDIYNSGTINILGEVKSDIHLISNKGTIGLKAKDTDGDGKVGYGGSYSLTNTTLDLSGDGAKEVTLQNLTLNNTDLKWDVAIDSLTGAVIQDTINASGTGVFSSLIMDIAGAEKNKWYTVSLAGENGNAIFDETTGIILLSENLYKTKNIYNDDKTQLTDVAINIIEATLPTTLGEVLRSTTASTFDLSQYNITLNDGETLNYMITDKDLSDGSMGELGTGKKTIVGVTNKALGTVINANGISKLFNLSDGDELSLSNLTIMNANSVIYNYNNTTGSVTLNNVDFINNTSSSNGGAIYNNGSNATIAFNGDASFSGNSSSSNGGAIYNSGGTITFGGDATFTDNTATSSSGNAYGGAIYNYANGSNATVTFNGDASFSGNSATGSSSSYGGAIYNNGSNATVTFNGDATFTNNSVTVTGSYGYAYGGAIYNYDSGSNATVTFNGDASFTGNSATATGSSGKVNGGAIYNSGTITFGGDASFSGNSATGSSSSYGGAIYNNGSNATVTFNGDATFTGNSVIGSSDTNGGAIYNSGTITFGGDVSFSGNSATGSSYSYGGAIDNHGSTTFNGDVIFTDNSANSTGSAGYGGAIYNSRTITFNGDASFSSNSVTAFYEARGGAIYNSGTITFNGDATFTGNSATGSSASGGAIYNNGGSITFGGDATFSGNSETSSSGNAYGGAIYNQGVITFGGDASFTGNSVTDSSSANGGAIYNYGTITFNDGSTVTFSGNRASRGGAIYNNVGTITFGGDATFTDNSASSSGGAIYNNSTITFGEDSTLTFENNKVNDELNDIYNSSGTINILGTVKSDIHLISNKGTIGLKAKDTDGDGKVGYGGSYSLTNTTLDLSGDGAKEVTLQNLTLNHTPLKWDIEIDSLTGAVIQDTINASGTGVFSSLIMDFSDAEKDKWYTVSLANKNGDALFDETTKIEVLSSDLYKIKNIYNDDKSEVIGLSINFPDVALPTLGEVLRSTTASIFDFSGIVGDAETLYYVVSEKDLSNGSMGEIGTGKKTIIGLTNKAFGTIINANGISKLFNLGDGDELSLSNLTIMNAKQALYNYNNTTGSVTLNNVDFINNSASSNGGAIYNYDGTITFNGDATFTGNSSSSFGGVIYNYAYNSNATITFNGDATFSGNLASSSGGVIYNYSYKPNSNASITFDGDATFSGNSSSASGGAIYNYGYNAALTFGGDATFTGNSATVTGSSGKATGGAIVNYGSSATVTFNGDATFTGNSATGSYAYAGAIDNGRTITFEGDATFMGNSVTGSDAYAGAIYNSGSNATTIFNGDATFTGNSATATGSSGKAYGGAIDNNATITFEGDATFTGNTATSSSGNAYGGAIYNNGTITFGEDSTLSFSNNIANGELNDIYNSSGTINILGEVKSDIYLISEGGTIGLKAKDVDNDGKVSYGGSYDLTNATLDISRDGIKELTIEDLILNNTALKWDVEIKENDAGYNIISDIGTLTPTGEFSAGEVLLLSKNKNKWFDVSYSGIYDTSIFAEDAKVDVYIDGFYKMKDIYDETQTTKTGFSINFVESGLTQSLGDFLRSTTALTIDLSQYNLTVDEDASINYMIAGKDFLNGSMGSVGAGKKTIVGATDKAEDTIINANGTLNLFNLSDGDELSLSNLTITNAKQALYNDNNTTGSVTLNNVDFINNTSSSYGGAIYNNGGTIIFGEDATFSGNSSSSNGGAIYNNGGTIIFGEDATISFSENYANNKQNDIYNTNGTISILGMVASDIHLISSGGRIGLKAKDTDGDGKVSYGGSYQLSSTALDVSGDGAKEITIEGLTVSSGTLKWDVEFTSAGIVQDVINTTATGKFASGTVNIMGEEKDKWYDVTFSELGSHPMLKDGVNVSTVIEGLYKTQNETETGLSVNFLDVTLSQSLGEVLRSNTAAAFDLRNISLKEGETLNYGINENDLLNGSMGEGEKTIIGATDKAEDTIINANWVGSVFNLSDGDELTLSNLTIMNAKKAIDNYNNTSGKVTLNNVDFINNSATASAYVSVHGGAIDNSGTITFGGDVTFSGNAIRVTNSSGYGGAIYNNGSNATIIFNGDATFSGNSSAASSAGSTASAYGGAIYNNGGTITFNGDATFTGNTASAGGYKPTSNGGAITNGGTITFGENSILSFENNKGSGKVNDIYNSGIINILGTVASDIHLISSAGIIGLKAKDTVNKDENGNLKYTGSYSLTNTTLDTSGDGLKEITIENLTGSNTKLVLDVEFEEVEGVISMVTDKLTLSEKEYKFSGVDLSMKGDEVLNKIVEGLSVNQNGEFELSHKYQATVLGGGASFADTQETLLNSSSIFALEVATSGQELSVEANKLKGTALEYLTSKTGNVTLQMTGDETGVSYNMAVSGELVSMAVGKKQLLGAFDDASKNVITANGREMFTLENEGTEFIVKDITISGAKEVINNQAGTVSLENVVIADSTGDVAIQNEATLNLKDVTVDKGIYNDGSIMAEGKISLGVLEGTGVLTMNEAMLTATSIDAETIKNNGSLIVSKDLSVGALEGTGTLTMNEATLEVMDKFATTNKVISNNMKIGNEVQEISFGDLEIMAGTTLDIDNKHVTANKVTFGEESTLSVTLNHLADYGTLTHEEVEGDEAAKLNLKLTNGIDTESGIYQVFNKDNNLTLLDNNLLDIVDMGDGSYQVRKKADAILEADLGMSKEQVDTVGALLKEDNAAPKRFLMMQEEVLEALQSEDKATVEKAKQALNALGGRSTSLYQSQATAGFTQLHNVVSQMLMNTAAPVFGHAGGEEPARASVYIKGLYDRVNSLTGDGFRMRSKGAVLGVQSALTEDLTIGVGYAGVDTTAKEPLRRTEVKTNTGFVSAQYQPNNWWVNGVVTYSRSQYDEEKHVLSSTGEANYDVDSIGAQITTGYNIKKGKVIITPEVGIRYLNTRQEGYSDSLGTTVEATNSDFVTTMAGFKVGADLGWIRPLAGVMVGYDVITDDVASVNTLANGSTYTINGKALDRLSTTVVAGFGMDIGENATLKLEYNGNYRKEYLDHSGMIRLEMKF